jgi:hypothetical protein
LKAPHFCASLYKTPRSQCLRANAFIRRLPRSEVAAANAWGFGLANPGIYDYLEAEAVKYVIRLPANRVLQVRIGHLLTRPVGRPPHEVRRFYASFNYQAGSSTRPHRVVAKVEWHPAEHCLASGSS